MDIKENVSQNLIKYRKAIGITQAELAEKLNYSDKAVSKWERAESVPDIYILHQIAELFGISVDTLISPPKEEKPSFVKQVGKIRFMKGVLATALVWLISIVCFVLFELIIPVFSNTWLLFIYAIPITLLILFILTSVWGKNLWNMIFVSLFFWMLLVSIYLSLIVYMPNVPEKYWEIFIIGIPIQVLVIMYFYYNKIKAKLTKHKHQ